MSTIQSAGDLFKLDPRFGLHWYTYTTTEDQVPVMSALPGVWSRFQRPGRYGHPGHYVHETGVELFAGSKNKDQPLVLNCPGWVCESWSDLVVDHSVTVKGTATRIDVACDVSPAEEARRRLQMMQLAWNREQVETRMRKESIEWHESKKEGDGRTVYFGGKQAERRLRAYDRRGPLRLEWQYRPDDAAGPLLPHVLKARGCAPVWRGCAENAIWPFPWYKELVWGDVARFEKKPEVDSNLAETIAQLKKQLGPTLWALKQLGALDDIIQEPGEKATGAQLKKFMRWANEAKATSSHYNGSWLAWEIKRLAGTRKINWFW